MTNSKKVKSIKSDATTSNKQISKTAKLKKGRRPGASKLKKLSDTFVEEPSIYNTGRSLEKTSKQPINFVSAPKKLVSVLQAQLGVKALFEYNEKSANEDNLLFDDEKPIFLQITSIKVADTPSRILRLCVPHTLLTDSSEICLIVKDIGKPKEHDDTIEYFERLLNERGVTNIKTIMPYHQFKTEYGNQFELKRNLLSLYDCFLVDSRISGYVAKLLGKIFMAKHKIPAPIKMEVPHLKSHIEKSLRKVGLTIHSKGDSFSVQVGHTKMEQRELSENLLEIIDQLDDFPGGMDNIRALSIKTDKSITIPIYVTLKNKNKVSVPVIPSKRPKHFTNVRGELTTFINKEVTVLPSGQLLVHTIEDSDAEDIDDKNLEIE